jgi:hypothetical protein
MSTEKVIGEFQKNSGERVRCQFVEFKGVKRIDLRVFYDAGKDGPAEDWRPTKSGLSLPREMVLDLKELIDAASEEYERGLPGPEQEKGKTEGEGEPSVDEGPLPF